MVHISESTFDFLEDKENHYLDGYKNSVEKGFSDVYVNHLISKLISYELYFLKAQELNEITNMYKLFEF